MSLRAAEPMDLMRAPALAHHDLALAFARHVDRLLDARRTVGKVLPLVGLDRHLVGQFVVQALEHFLARDFGGERAQRRVGDLVLGIEPRARLHHRGELVLHALDAVAVERGDHEGLARTDTCSLIVCASARSLRALDGVDLVEHQHAAAARLLREALEDRRALLVDALARVDQQAHDVGVARRRPRRCRPWRGRAGAWARRCRACRRR